MHFASLPDRRADRDPHGPAVSGGRRSLTNAQLLDRVRAASDHRCDLGIDAGDVVALKLRNRLEFVVLLFAAWRLGAAVTPVNPSSTDGEVVRQLHDSGARLLVVEDGATVGGDGATLAVGALRDEAPGEGHAPHLDRSALALLIYTSGTTGVPKGVMLDHANISAMAGLRAVRGNVRLHHQPPGGPPLRRDRRPSLPRAGDPDRRRGRQRGAHGHGR